MNEYNRDQTAAFTMVRQYLSSLTERERSRLTNSISPYLKFRKEVAAFQNQYFSKLCTHRCFDRRSSACCNREGIATFFADVVINALLSTEEDLDRLQLVLAGDSGGVKCVYLTQEGCIWRLKPIICEMFLCAYAKEAVLTPDPSLRCDWEELCLREKSFTWPDRPVLFDELEEAFIRAGFDSPLMYCHKSPGLMRLKAQGGGME